MVEPHRAIRIRRPITIVALFVVAFMLQGMSLAVFHADRHDASSEIRWIAASKVITVTNGFDDGDGSLRDAVGQANLNPGLDLIVIDASVVTVTLTSPLEITDGVSISPHFTDVITLPPPTVDASKVAGSVFVMTNHTDTHIDGLRIINASAGYGISATNAFTVTISNVSVENSMGGIQLGNTGVITATNVALGDIAGTGVEIKQSRNVHLGELLLTSIRGTGINVSDGVTDVGIFSSTISGGHDEFSSAIAVAGNPAPTGIVMRGNTYTDTSRPIFLASGANNGFPAPAIMNAFLFTDTGRLQVSLLSTANPVTYTYPLSIDLYKVLDGNYLPLSGIATYESSAYPNPITTTIPLASDEIGGDYRVAAVATTANPNTSGFSVPVALTPPPVDSDGDGVEDGDDLCPATVIPEATVPSEDLGVNRFALVDGDRTFDTVSPKGKGPDRSYTTAETGGCSCEQIIEELGLSKGHTKFGCSISAMDSWVTEVEGAAGKGNSDASRSEAVPETFVLEQNYPNPFNPATAITFELPEQRHVVLRVFDVMGRVVATLVDADLNQGSHRVTWNGRNAQGQSVSSGLYIYRIEAGDFSAEKTMSLLR